MRVGYLFTVLIFSFLECLPAHGQGNPPFSLISTELPAVRNGGTSWGDFDSDGDFDVAIMGESEKGNISRVYRNNGDFVAEQDGFWIPSTSYVMVTSLTEPLSQGLPSWTDFDDDGDLDVLFCGTDGTVSRCVLSEFHENAFVVHFDVPGLHSGRSSWVDSDSDGDLDAFITGIDDADNYMTILLENQGQSFTRIELGIPGIAFGDMAWADYDHDSDSDILVTGMSQQLGFITKLYRNEGSNYFTETDTAFERLGYSSVDWGDFDLDGDSDILLSGGRLSPYILEGVLHIYTNSNGFFSEFAPGLEGQYYGSTRWGDSNNDGSLDILLSGGTTPANSNSNAPIGARIGLIYENDGGIGFKQMCRCPVWG